MAITSVTPFLWFDNQAEDAANFYVALFPKSRIHQISRYGKNMPGPEGQVMAIDLELNGQRINMLNGGPTYQLSPAFSLIVNCETQEEIDHLWAALGEGGKEHACGWLTDRFGLTWQINYAGWTELLKQNSQKVMEAMMTMIKIDIQRLKDAAR